MTASDLLRGDIAAFGAAYASGESDPVSVIDALFATIDADTRGINAFCHLDRQGAHEQAQASVARWRAKAQRGPFDGLPVSIKDLMNVAGWPTRRGSKALADDPPVAQDALMVARLREAGAVLFGKTTTTEFGWTIASTNPQAGVTRNPLDPRRSAGGSSSGAAAQVAAGWGPLAIGSDAGGSVRIPASHCGVVGFKPSFAAIPSGTQSAFTELAHLGPLTRNMRDCALSTALLSFAHPRDPNSMFLRDDLQGEQPVPRTLRIGWTTGLGTHAALQPAVRDAFELLVDRLSAEGYVVQAVQPLGQDTAPAMWTHWAALVHESFVGWPPAMRERLSVALRAIDEQGARQSAADVARARTQLRTLITQMWELFASVDVLLTPTSPTTAPLLDDAAQTGAVTPHPDHGYNWFASNGFTYPFNLTQQPALSLPLGRDADGMPFGLQVVGRKYADGMVLRLGRELERLIAGR